MSNSKENADVVLRSVGARRQFWIDERDRARKSKNDQAAGEAQRFINEYDAFIDVIKHQTGERPAGVMRARRC